MDDEKIYEHDMGRLECAAKELLDQFDAVHIVAVRHQGDDAGTYAAAFGTGNFYSRVAAMEEALYRLKRAMRKD